MTLFPKLTTNLPTPEIQKTNTAHCDTKHGKVRKFKKIEKKKTTVKKEKSSKKKEKRRISKRKTVVKRKKYSSKGTIRPRTTGNQRIKALDASKSDKNDFNKMEILRTTFQYWQRTEKNLRQQTKTNLRKNNFLQKKDDYRLVGKFEEQQNKVLGDLRKKRFEDKPVSTCWLRARMKFHCEQDRPRGYNSEKDKFTSMWVKKFMK